MTFIVGDIIKISNGDAFYPYLGTDFVEKYVPNLSHLYKIDSRPVANNQNFVIISKTEYDWVYIIQDKDCSVDGKILLSRECEVGKGIDYKALIETGWKFVFEFYIRGTNDTILKKRFYTDKISFSLSNKTVRAKLYAHILGGIDNE